MWREPGEKPPNRAGLGAWGAYVNAIARRDYGRPLFIACSADLAESTNIAGFGQAFGELPGFGWYERDSNPTGALLPTEITEFTNAGMMAGLATVNFAPDPVRRVRRVLGRLLHLRLVQLSEVRAAAALQPAGPGLRPEGRQGPVRGRPLRPGDGRGLPHPLRHLRHGVTQLFPEGHVIDLHPWEYNEVPVVLAAAFGLDVPIVALHLTRPPVEIPDREALGIPSHFAAARGAYVLRDYRPDQPRGGTVFVRGHDADPEPGQRAAGAATGAST